MPPGQNYSLERQFWPALINWSKVSVQLRPGARHAAREMNGSEVHIEYMSPSKRPMRPEGYESNFARDAGIGMQGMSLASEQNDDSGFLQYVHLPSSPQSETMALYATPRTIESAFHHRHSAGCMVGSMIGSYTIRSSTCLNPVNAVDVPGGPVAGTRAADAVNSSSKKVAPKTVALDEDQSKGKSPEVPSTKQPLTSDWIARCSALLLCSALLKCMTNSRVPARRAVALVLDSRNDSLAPALFSDLRSDTKANESSEIFRVRRESKWVLYAGTFRSFRLEVMS